MIQSRQRFRINTKQQLTFSMLDQGKKMALYRVTTSKLESVQATTFAAESLLERRDLQRLLRQDISPIGDDLMIIAEEFGNWEDSNRRIDLLCLNRNASLVVVEIKRTEDGGHMELQSIRYAAMVSSMTLEQVYHTYSVHCNCDAERAKNEVLEFLQFSSEDEAELTGAVKIVLISADFSTELTTSVLWLNKQELDITCIRLRPYRMGTEVLIDATQIIPLPESADYEIKVRNQEKEKRKVMGARQELLRKFWIQFIERSKSKTNLLANRAPTTDHWLSAGIGRSGFGLNISLTQTDGVVDCYIRLPGGEEKSTAAFNSLLEKKSQIEEAFGEPLEWQDLPERQGCRIAKRVAGGWKSSESEWTEIQDNLISCLVRLEASLKKPIQEIDV